MANESTRGKLKNPKTNKAIKQALNEYEKRTQTPASKKVREDIATVMATVFPPLRIAKGLGQSVKAGAKLYNKTGIDKVVAQVIKANNPLSSPSTKTTARSILKGTKPKGIQINPKTGKPFVEIKTPVQRSVGKRRKAAVDKNKKASSPASEGQPTAVLRRDLDKQIKTRTLKEPKVPKDTIKIPVTKAMKKEMAAVKAVKQQKPLKKALKGAGKGVLGYGAAKTILGNDEVSKQYGGKVRRRMGGIIKKGFGKAQRGY